MPLFVTVQKTCFITHITPTSQQTNLTACGSSRTTHVHTYGISLIRSESESAFGPLPILKCSLRAPGMRVCLAMWGDVESNAFVPLAEGCNVTSWRSCAFPQTRSIKPHDVFVAPSDPTTCTVWKYMLILPLCMCTFDEHALGGCAALFIVDVVALDASRVLFTSSMEREYNARMQPV